MIPISTIALTLLVDFKILDSKVIGRIIACLLYVSILILSHTTFNLEFLSFDSLESTLTSLPIMSYEIVAKYILIGFFAFIFSGQYKVNYNLSFIRLLPFVLIGISDEVLMVFTFFSFWYFEGLVNGRISFRSKLTIFLSVIAILFSTERYSVNLPGPLLSIFINFTMLFFVGSLLNPDFILVERQKVEVFKRTLFRLLLLGVILKLIKSPYVNEWIVQIACIPFVGIDIFRYIRTKYTYRIYEITLNIFLVIWLLLGKFNIELLSLFVTFSIINYYFEPKINANLESRLLQKVIKASPTYIFSIMSGMLALILITTSVLLSNASNFAAFTMFIVLWFYMKSIMGTVLIAYLNLSKERKILNQIVIFWAVLLNLLVIL